MHPTSYIGLAIEALDNKFTIVGLTSKPKLKTMEFPNKIEEFLNENKRRLLDALHEQNNLVTAIFEAYQAEIATSTSHKD